MISNDIKELMKSSVIKISKGNKKINYENLSQMAGKDLLECKVMVRGHEAFFFRGTISNLDFYDNPKKGIGYHYRNFGVSASEGNPSAIELINSAYNTSLCWDSEDRIML